MIEKLTVVGVVVKDQAKALDYYTKVLGLEKRSDFTGPTGVRWLTVGPKGQDIEISLFQAGSYPDQKGGQFQLQPGKGTGWTFQSTDCKKDFEVLKSRGVKFDQNKPAEYPYGIQASFSDPDGNAFILLQMAAKQVW
ncbi:MAG TPA: VOC family protein [Nitrososphaerales archaeon]|nr:VOC family protein [Nitrososphaerales archaeon]HUK75597.1 VOC family protein [Nitrososphaerales archaeon]